MESAFAPQENPRDSLFEEFALAAEMEADEAFAADTEVVPDEHAS
jgi:hypothetical protein